MPFAFPGAELAEDPCLSLARPLPLPSGTVHVWRAPLEITARQRDTFWATLSSDEQERADRFRFDRHRDAFIAARGTLRQRLAEYVGTTPIALRFRYGSHGKPALVEESDLRFNLSHAGQHLLIACTQGREIGIDVEPIRTLPRADDIAERFFSAREVEEYRTLSSDLRPASFFHIWTQKEAFVKAIGGGLSHPLSTFDVSVHPDTPPGLHRLADGAASDWQIARVPMPPDVRATVATSGSAPLTLSTFSLFPS